jgi:hypothetical protein
MSSGAADQVWNRAMAKETTIMQATAKLIFMTYLSDGIEGGAILKASAENEKSTFMI